MEVLRAIVIDNNDPDQKSKIQVKILPHFKDVEDRYLPWILPYTNGINSLQDQGTHQIPEVDSVIRVLVTSWVKKNFFWIGSEALTDFNIYEKFTNDVAGNISDLGTQTYPQPFFVEVYADGSSYFRNTETSEWGYYNSNGTYTINDADGNLFIYGKDKNIKIYNDEITVLLDNTNKLFNIVTGSIDFKLDETNKKSSIVTTNTSISLDETSKEVIAETGTAKLTLNSASTATFKLEDGRNTLESDLTSVKINNNLQVLI